MPFCSPDSKPVIWIALSLSFVIFAGVVTFAVLVATDRLLRRYGPPGLFLGSHAILDQGRVLCGGI